MISSKVSDRVKGINFSKIREMTSKAKKMKSEGMDIIELSQGRPDLIHLIILFKQLLKR